MVGIILMILVIVWFITLIVAQWPPESMTDDTYIFIEGLAVVMPFIIVFGGIAVGAIAAIIQMIFL